MIFFSCMLILLIHVVLAYITGSEIQNSLKACQKNGSSAELRNAILEQAPFFGSYQSRENVRKSTFLSANTFLLILMMYKWQEFIKAALSVVQDKIELKKILQSLHNELKYSSTPASHQEKRQFVGT